MEVQASPLLKKHRSHPRAIKPTSAVSVKHSPIMAQDIAPTKGFLSNSIFFCAPCRQFYHYGLKPQAVPGVQWDLCSFSGTGEMARRVAFLQECSRDLGVGAWWDLVRMENCHVNTPPHGKPNSCSIIPCSLCCYSCTTRNHPQRDGSAAGGME